MNIYHPGLLSEGKEASKTKQAIVLWSQFIMNKPLSSSRKHIMSVLREIMGEVKAQVGEQLRSAEYVSLTTDFWTSNAVQSYMSVTAHFVTPDWSLSSKVLQTREVSESHTSVKISDELKAVAQEWNLEEKMTATTTDNARNYVGGVRVLSWQHIPCFAHTLNKAVNEGIKLPVLAQILSCCRKFVGHLRHSYLAQSALQSKQSEYGLPQHKLIQDIPTRWNSAYEMLQVYP